MSLTINHNLMAMNAARNLAVSELMRSDIFALHQANSLPRLAMQLIGGQPPFAPQGDRA